MDTPQWLREALAAEARGEEARSRAADDRARWIAKGVEEYGRGGRQKAADALGITVGQVDKALARARSVDRPSYLPPAEDLLERLFALEMAELEPLPDVHRQVLRSIARSAPVDVTWLHNPGDLLAQEVEDIDPDELPLGVEQASLAQTCRSWNRLQALAALDSLRNGS